MSLMRRFSRRMSGSKKNEDKQIARSDRKKRIDLNDTPPVPVTRQMTSADFFKPTTSSAVQSTAMDRTLFEIPQPNQVDAMTDLIKDHEEGSLFPYVGVVGTEGESSDARRARMLALKPSYNKRDIPEIKILACPLVSREGTFTMDMLMKHASTNTEPIPDLGGPVPNGIHNVRYEITKPYVHIRQITALFTPNVSSTSNYCNFWMNLVDNRLIDSDKGSQTNVAVSNQESILEMSCDYCVPSRELQSFSLGYTLERDIVHPGFQWGTTSFYFSITESDLPFQSSKVDAMGVYRMPITTLLKRETNADKADISFTPADVVKLREMYSRGDIVDVDEPQHAKLKTNSYSKSSIRAQPKGREINVTSKPGWEFMSGSRAPKMDAEVASVEPEDDDDDYQPPSVDLEAAKIQRQEAIARYKAQQEEERGRLREQDIMSDTTEEVHRTMSPGVEDDREAPSALDSFFAPKKEKKVVRIGPTDV